MISIETLDDYHNRTFSLAMLFKENLSKAEDLVVEDSTIDFNIHKFICSVHYSNLESALLTVQFSLKSMGQSIEQSMGREDDKNKINELIERFHSLKKELDIQNDFLERFTKINRDKSQPVMSPAT